MAMHHGATMLRAVSSTKGRPIAALLCFLIFIVTKTYFNRELLNDGALDLEVSEESPIQSFADPSNCQIIYVLGVEGAIHHGFTPILERLARQQVDPTTNFPYVVTYAHRTLKSAIFGLWKESRPLDNHSLVREVIRDICPHNGRKHVIIEDSSFPCGPEDDVRTYRIHRQSWWLDATMEEIAMSETALNHPTNLNRFYEAYSEYADIKFVVIHRSYIETVASHHDLDGTAVQHSNVIRGFMLLLHRFLDAHPIDKIWGQRLWTVVCMEQMMLKFHGGDKKKMYTARRHIVEYLAEFLGWPSGHCPDCYKNWKDSDKNHLQLLGESNVAIVLDHMRKLGGIWPPVVENPLEEQKCTL